jgi:hypothetical protein
MHACTAVLLHWCTVLKFCPVPGPTLPLAHVHLLVRHGHSNVLIFLKWPPQLQLAEACCEVGLQLIKCKVLQCTCEACMCSVLLLVWLNSHVLS